jgi:hypothetical protein
MKGDRSTAIIKQTGSYKYQPVDGWQDLQVDQFVASWQVDLINTQPMRHAGQDQPQPELVSAKGSVSASL